jgi:hypothetical protein
LLITAALALVTALWIRLQGRRAARA